MKVVNYSDFRNNLAENLNMVNDDGDIVIVSRTKGKTVVVMSLEEYNSIQETMHLTSTKANRDRLDQAVKDSKEKNSKKFAAHKLIQK